MALEHLMVHRVDWLRPNMATDKSAAEFVKDFTTKGEDIPVSVQPMSARELEFFYLRGMEVSHAVYTATINDYQKNDRLMFGTREFVVVGVRNLIELNRVQVLDCKEYPSTGKMR